ncbi:MAG TPA: farnesyl diphosphate synthase [Candidatus Polarisedimenticolaceae bacterium]
MIVAADLASWIELRRPQVERALERILPAPEGPAATAIEAMRYAVFGGGKRLRPLLAVAAYEACGGAAETTPWEPAAALELVHTYSLVHDDLPAMDDDDLRRGRATVHRAYGEAEAILAGDGLLTLAFEVLARHPEAVAAVARAAGIGGMVGGQMADLEAEGRATDLDGVVWIHAHKTGALLAASAELGAILAGAPTAARDALGDYGRALGLAFQAHDDVLDLVADARTLGKTPGKDRDAGKATIPSLLGLDGAREEAARWAERAERCLDGVPLASRDTLAAFARWSVARAA